MSAIEFLENRYYLSAAPPSYLQSLVASQLTSNASAAAGPASVRLNGNQQLAAALSGVGPSTTFNLSGGEVDAAFDTAGRINLLPLAAGSASLAPLPTGDGDGAALPLATSALVFQGQDNVNDTLALDLDHLPRDASGNLAVNTVVYNGGVGGWDTLVVAGGSFKSEIYHPTGKDSGIITYQLPDSSGPLMPGQNTTGQSFTIIFAGLEPVESYGSASYLEIDDYNPGDQIFAVDGTPHSGQDTIKVYEASNNFENITFANKQGLVIETWSGDSTIDISGVSTTNTALAATVTNGLVLWGASGNNVLKANAATNLNQSLNANGGNNTFYAAGGGTYPTYLYGYDGNATYMMPTSGNIYIGGDTDAKNSLDFSALSSNVTVDLGSTSSQTVATGLTVTLATNTTITNAIGGSGNDTITGNSLDNYLNGGAGNDTLYGLNGNDVLDGGADTDRLYGGAGTNDITHGEGEWLVQFNGISGNTPAAQLDNIRTLFHNAGLDSQGVDATEHMGVDGVVTVQTDPTSSQSTVQNELSSLAGFSLMEAWDENASNADREIWVPPGPDDEGGQGSGDNGYDRDIGGLSGPGLIEGFDGIDQSHTAGFVIPPDPIGAAGPSSYIDATNVSLAIFNKTTGAIISGSGSPTRFSDFFAHSNSDLDDPILDPTDPIVCFNENIVNADSSVGQFFVGIVDRDYQSRQSRLEVAISKTNHPSILTATDWNFYRVDTSEGATYFSDYPRLGYNAEGYAISFNMFQFMPAPFFVSGHPDHVSIVGISLMAAVVECETCQTAQSTFRWRQPQYTGRAQTPEYGSWITSTKGESAARWNSCTC